MRKGVNNPYTFRIHENSSEGRFNYLMDNVMEATQHSLYGTDLHEDYRDYVCLSGKVSEDNDAGSKDKADATEVEDDNLSYIQVLLRPYVRNGDPNRNNCQIPSPAAPGLTTIEQNTRIGLHFPKYQASSVEPLDSISSPAFGQIVSAKFFKGSAKKFDQHQLRFKIKEGEPYIPSEYKSLGLTAASFPTAQGSFDNSNPALLGALSEGIDPRYPPREWIYRGTNANYSGQRVQNGNLPAQLLGYVKQGVSKPQILAELVSGYDQMAIDFAKAFPGDKLSIWGYRPYSRQLKIKKEKPNLSAKPGTSNHGWGQAIDVHYYNSANKRQALYYEGPHYKWLAANSKKYGWFNPPWAVQGGSKEEPWHWESTTKLFTKG